jgi:hypothetical protein
MNQYASRRLINTLAVAFLLFIGFAIAIVWLRNVPISTCEVQTVFERQKPSDIPTAVFNLIAGLWQQLIGVDLFLSRVLSIFFIIISCSVMLSWSRHTQISILIVLPLVVFGISTSYWGWSTPHAFFGLLITLVGYSFSHLLDRLEQRYSRHVLGGFGIILILSVSFVLWSNKYSFSRQVNDYSQQITQLPASLILLWLTTLIGVSVWWWDSRRTPKQNRQMLLILMWLCIPICLSAVFTYWTSLLTAIIIPAIAAGLIIILNGFDSRVRLVAMLLMIVFSLSRFPNIYYSYSLGISQVGFSDEFRRKYIPDTPAIFVLDKSDGCSKQGDLIAQVAPTITVSILAV